MSASPALQPPPANSPTRDGAPGNRHEAPVVFFDGVCGLCNHSVNMLLRLDKHARLQFAPLQGETAQAQLPPAQRDLNSLVLKDQAGVWRSSSAVVRILGHLGGIWLLPASALWLIPRPLRNWGYRLIAEHRYRWFGHTEACRMPRPGEAARFLP